MLKSFKLPTLMLSLSLSAFAGTAAMAAASHNVPWYLSNANARAATLATCNADPGDLAATPDCVNAAAAAQDATNSVL